MENKNTIILTKEENETLKRTLKKELNILQKGLAAFKFESNKPAIETLKNIINKL